MALLPLIALCSHLSTPFRYYSTGETADTNGEAQQVRMALTHTNFQGGGGRGEVLSIFHSQFRRALTVRSIPFRYSSTGGDSRHQ